MKKEVSKFKITIEKFISKEKILYYHEKKENYTWVIRKHEIKRILYMIHEDSIEDYLGLEIMNVKIKKKFY